MVTCSYISVTLNLTRMRDEIMENYINSSSLAVPFNPTVAVTSFIGHAENCSGMSIRMFRNIILLLKTFNLQFMKFDTNSLYKEYRISFIVSLWPHHELPIIHTFFL